MAPQPVVSVTSPDHPDACIIHTDAAWCPIRKVVGLGWTFSFENTTLSFSRPHSWAKNPLVAKGLALRAALFQAAEDNIRNISVKSDSFQLIEAINTGSGNIDLHGILGHIDFLSRSFSSISFSFISRKLNCTADSLAKSSLCNSPSI
ncbi:uncharacterized protein LOC112086663 [Eutrema salsugineum]|uniref:uncharacterized protein LOC112086663 n=1 Tax=Eutrema salsugineum TaxID=72664 RepID=UPI000CED02EC|nr:uncharacterized protein LOC112086663 [Eutrema salsugineum]